MGNNVKAINHDLFLMLGRLLRGRGKHHKANQIEQTASLMAIAFASLVNPKLRNKKSPVRCQTGEDTKREQRRNKS